MNTSRKNTDLEALKSSFLEFSERFFKRLIESKLPPCTHTVYQFDLERSFMEYLNINEKTTEEMLKIFCQNKGLSLSRIDHGDADQKLYILIKNNSKNINK